MTEGEGGPAEVHDRVKPSPSTDSEALHRAFGALLRGESPDVSADGFVPWAEAHRLAPYAHLLATQVGSPLATGLRRCRIAAAAQEAARSTWTRGLLAALVEHGSTPIVFKGLGVAHSHYPSPELRVLGDLDLMIRRPDLDAAIDAAQSVGFRHEYPDPLAIAYHREDSYDVPMVTGDGRHLELHHALYREFPERYLATALADAQPTTVYDVPVRRLAPEDLFLVLAVHWSTSDPGSLWVWLLDLYLIARAFSPLQWQRLAERAIQHGLASFAVLALDTITRLWSVSSAPPPVTASLTAALRPPERWLRRHLPRLLRGGVVNGDLVRGVHRVSLRRSEGRFGPLRAVLPHAGATCIELGVASGTPGFWLHRTRHVAVRLRRAALAMFRFSRIADRR